MLALVLAVTLSVSPAAHSPAPAPTPSATSETHPASAETVTVNGAALTGQPVQTVVHQLQQLHLTVRVQWQPSDQQPPGRVVQVQPTGRVAAASTVTVTGALQQAAPPSPGNPHSPGNPPGQQHGQGRGHGHKHGHGDNQDDQ